MLLLLFCQTVPPIHPDVDRIAGLSFVAPPDPFEENPMLAVKQISANAISVIPYGFTRSGEPNVQFNITRWQWWGERSDGVIETIRLAHDKKLTVMVKPQLYIPGSWTGDMTFDSDQEWSAWESAYEDFILTFAKIADSMETELFCLGTEFKTSVNLRPQFWKNLILKVRTVFSGKITYAANWDDFDEFPYWNLMDFIGVNAYFPLSDLATPTVLALTEAWQPYVHKIEQLAITENKPIIFTEYGYLSVDHCAHKTWELEKKVKSLPINEQAQANALDALLLVYSAKPYWKGGFLWKWFPNGQGHEGYPERDYTPQDKVAHDVIRDWYSQF